MGACDAFSDTELRALAVTFARKRWVDKRDRALLALGVSCPARVSELLALSARDVTEEDGSVSATWHCRAANNKTGVAVDYEITAGARRALEVWLAERKQSGYRKGDPLFPAMGSNAALSRGAVWLMIKRRCRMAGLKTKGKGTHSMKHTAVANAYDSFNERAAGGEKGVDPLRDTQAFSGHKTLGALLHYLRPRRASARSEGFAAAAKGGALLAGEESR